MQSAGLVTIKMQPITGVSGKRASTIYWLYNSGKGKMNRSDGLVCRLLAYGVTEQGSTLGLTSGYFVTLGKILKSFLCHSFPTIKEG